MNWINYCKSNSFRQIVSDCREYRALRAQLRQAKACLANSVRLLSDDRDASYGIKVTDTCLKHKIILNDTHQFELDNYRLVQSRCKFFEPIGNEKLCSNKQCACWSNNKQYHQNLDSVKTLVAQVAQFWSDKFANVK